MSTDQKFTELKGRIARGEYVVDCGLVAGELIARLRLVYRVRRRLVPGAGGGPSQPPARVPVSRERRFRRRSETDPSLREGHAAYC